MSKAPDQIKADIDAETLADSKIKSQFAVHIRNDLVFRMPAVNVPFKLNV